MINKLIYKILVGHITLSVFQNTPDTLVPSLQHYTPGWDIPQWRFFAPSPGTSNHHIFYKTREKGNEKWSEWQEMHTPKYNNLLSLFWNPESRYIKANFDLASSIINLVSYGASFQYIKTSEPYISIKEMLNHKFECSNIDEYQFLIAISKSEISTDGAFSFEPKMFSEILRVG